MKPQSMTVAEAQHDMRYAYFGGSTGLLASALAWLASGVSCVVLSPASGVVVLLAGGVMIYPVSVGLSKAVGRPGVHTRGNPLGALALEGTVLMLLAIPLAYAISLYRLEWFFPAMLLVIGGRYLTFATLYGLRIYWACGGTLALVALLLVFAGAPIQAGAFVGAVVEFAFAVAVALAVRGGRLSPRKDAV